MKLIRSLSAGLCGLGLLAAASAQQPQNPVRFELPQVGTGAPAQTQPAQQTAPATATAPAAAPVQTFTEAQMLEVYGWLLATRNGLPQLEFSAANVEAMARGMSMAVTGRQPTYDAQQIQVQLQDYLGRKQQAFLLKVRNQNLADAANFFTKLKENKAVKELTSGLRYEVLREGRGAMPKAGQVVRMHYTGAFIDGSVFDTSLRQPQNGGSSLPEPVEALMQEGAVIPGVYEALTKMNPGSKWKIYIPPHLAFGDDGVPQIGIPPAATLIYEVELFEVNDAPKADAAKK
jgi:FKBP-type peptidyl-prolyl cis-trans isomerase